MQKLRTFSNYLKTGRFYFPYFITVTKDVKKEIPKRQKLKL